MNGWSSALRAGLVLWVASLAVLANVRDWTSIAISLGFGAFLTFAWLVTMRFVREPTEPPRGALEAMGPPGRRAARSIVVALACVLMGCVAFDFAGMRVAPWLFHAWLAVERTILPPLGTGSPKFVFCVLVPGVLVMALGARPREIGLGLPARGTLWATFACTALFLVAWGFRLAQGRLTIDRLGLFLAHNVLSNGFSEEFLSRGLVLSHARAFMRSGWALLLQALVFAALHIGVSLHDEPNLPAILANVVALNGPMGYALGLMTLRTRSLVLPAALHTAFDTTRNVFA